MATDLPFLIVDHNLTSKYDGFVIRKLFSLITFYVKTSL